MAMVCVRDDVLEDDILMNVLPATQHTAHYCCINSFLKRVNTVAPNPFVNMSAN
jgi:hypothetical protein